MTGSPYHPAPNGAAERLVQTFKSSLKKSKRPPKEAVQEFLMQYRRSPLASGYSPSELLNNRQIRANIDTLLPSPAHIAQERQAQENTKSQAKELEDSTVSNVHKLDGVGTPCYALCCGPRRTNEPKWAPATVVIVHGSRSVNVKVHPRRPIWRRHLEQLLPRYAVDDDSKPGQDVQDLIRTQNTVEQQSVSGDRTLNSPASNVPSFGPDNPRRSTRTRRRKEIWNY